MKILQGIRVLDLGTGSGAIALALQHSRPALQVQAVDASHDALAVAQANAQRLGLRVDFRHGHWLDAVEGRFDLIASNPPYIADQDPHLTQGDVRFEPPTALTDYASGLSCLEIIIAGADKHLKPGGLIAVVHGFDQSEAVVGLMKEAGLLDSHAHLDLAGHHRAASRRKRL